MNVEHLALVPISDFLYSEILYYDCVDDNPNQGLYLDGGILTQEEINRHSKDYCTSDIKSGNFYLIDDVSTLNHYNGESINICPQNGSTSEYMTVKVSVLNNTPTINLI